jgi:hypothetical protein
MATQAKTRPVVAVAGGVAGAVMGWALSQYCGIYLLIPGVAAVLLLILFQNTPFRPRHFRGAIGLAGAHLIWFVLAAALLGTWTPVVLDIIALLFGVVWLWVSPGLPAAIFLGVIELASLIVNGIYLNAAQVGDPVHRGPVVHIVLRILVLGCLAAELQKYRGEKAQEPGFAVIDPSPAERPSEP